MASLIDIRRRLRSVKSTQQITKAMKMVAAAKLRRAQDRVVAARPYAKLLSRRSRLGHGAGGAPRASAARRPAGEARHRPGRRRRPGPLRRLQHERQPGDGEPARGAPGVDRGAAAAGRQEGRRLLEAAQVSLHREVLRRHLRRLEVRGRPRDRHRFSPRSSWRRRSTPSTSSSTSSDRSSSQVVRTVKLLPLSREDAAAPKAACGSDRRRRLPLRARRAARSWPGSCRATSSSRSTARSLESAAAEHGRPDDGHGLGLEERGRDDRQAHAEPTTAPARRASRRN